jgi:hypothetical protein
VQPENRHDHRLLAPGYVGGRRCPRAYTTTATTTTICRARIILRDSHVFLPCDALPPMPCAHPPPRYSRRTGRRSASRPWAPTWRVCARTSSLPSPRTHSQLIPQPSSRSYNSLKQGKVMEINDKCVRLSAAAPRRSLLLSCL